jgi:hypothetical protein
MHPPRLPALLGKRCIVDHPGFDRAATRHYRFTHFSSISLSDHLALADKVQHKVRRTGVGTVTAGIGVCRSSLASSPEQ